MAEMTTSPETTRAAELFREHLNANYRRTSRMFAWLMVVQWLAGIAAAVWISPLTWEGQFSHTHIHVWAAIFLGGVITCVPVWLALTRPAATSTRHAVAIGQMLMSGLLVHLTGGRIETHFHYFGSLAFVAFYRDWRVLLTATLVVAADHFVRGIFWPLSIFGVLTASPWRWLEHSGWVVFEDIFLLVAMRQNLRELFGVAERQAELEALNESFERKVEERTVAIKQAQDEAALKEAQLRFIFEAVPFSVTWIHYRGGQIERMMNHAFYRITGLESGKIPDVSDIRAISFAEDLKRQDDYRGQLNRGEIDEMSMEKRYRRPNGEVIWVVLTIKVFRGPEGRILQEVSTLVDITERKQAEIELEQLHKQLLETSRQAGMAEVATGVLHNVGNVLNSVNVSSTLVSDQVRRSKIPNLGKVCVLLNEHAADLSAYVTQDPKGKVIPAYLSTLAEQLNAEHRAIVRELENLRKNIEHIKEIVAMQQSYAKTSGVVETVSVPDLVEDAIRMNAGSLARHDVDINRDYQDRPVITLEKNKVLQIIVNLVRNAKYACDESGRTDKQLTTRITADDQSVTIEITDNGVGIPPENLTRIFAHGFTTRKDGHGFGLHSGALAAKELGGSLIAHSNGPGQGATFILKLPYKPNAPTP